MKPIAALMLLLALTGCKEKEKVLKVTLINPPSPKHKCKTWSVRGANSKRCAPR